MSGADAVRNYVKAEDVIDLASANMRKAHTAYMHSLQQWVLTGSGGDILTQCHDVYIECLVVMVRVKVQQDCMFLDGSLETGTSAS